MIKKVLSIAVIVILILLIILVILNIFGVDILHALGLKTTEVSGRGFCK